MWRVRNSGISSPRNIPEIKSILYNEKVGLPKCGCTRLLYQHRVIIFSLSRHDYYSESVFNWSKKQEVRVGLRNFGKEKW